MRSMRKVLSLAQKGLVLNRNKRKLLAITYSESKHMPEEIIGKLGLPGGQIDFGEDLDKSFVREVKEETGVLIKPSLPFYIYTWQYKKGEVLKQIIAIARLAFFSRGKPINKPRIEKESTIETARWISIDKIKIKEFIEDEQPVLKKFLEYQKKNPFSLPSKT